MKKRKLLGDFDFERIRDVITSLVDGGQTCWGFEKWPWENKKREKKGHQNGSGASRLR